MDGIEPRALRGPFFCAALGAQLMPVIRRARPAVQPRGRQRSKRGRPSNGGRAGRRAQGAGYASDRPASGGADIYRYIPASGGADISAGRPASGGAGLRPWSRGARWTEQPAPVYFCLYRPTNMLPLRDRYYRLNLR